MAAEVKLIPRAHLKAPSLSAMSRSLVYRLPDLAATCPTQGSLHPDRARSTAESNAWICSEEALGANDAGAGAQWIKNFSRWDIPLLVAYCYPYASYEKLRLCCDVMNLVFAIDQITDSQSGAEASETVNHHIRILYGDPCDGSPVSKATSAIREGANSHFRPIAFRRFLATYKEYLDAVIIEAELRERKEILPVEEYRVLRRAIGGPRPCFALMEACFDIDLPDEVVEHPILKRMSDAACDLICWANDLYSYRKEHALDGPTCSNVITSLIHEKNFTLQEAVDHIGDEFRSLMDQFLSDKAALPSFGPGVDADVKAYILGLEYWIIGNIHFSYEGPRYFGDDREEIRRTRVVRLFTSSDNDSEDSD